MAKLYKQNMIAILTKLGVGLPDHFEMDQMQAELLLGKIKVALDAYDPTEPATGNATEADVLVGKTFSNATDVGLTGTYDFAVATAGTATAADIATGKTAWVAGVQITGTAV